MQVIPAIDLMKGRVVRLFRGDPDKATYYDNMGTPLEIAKKWQTQGAERLHIVDLDAAFGKPDNLQVVAEITQATGLPVQVGGGIRSEEAAKKLLSAGIAYVILGSLAFRDPAAITRIQAKFPDRVIVSLDNREGMVMVEGWTTSTTVSVLEALEEFANLGVKTFLVTSITRDGTLSGPDLDTLNEACRSSGVSVIAAGGIGSLADLAALSHTGVAGTVVGKALYEGRFTLEQAIKTVRQEQRACR
ncbi:MAG: 1-(5-phosphoribosyl)-5-[(5-phosphoribosylamino)methylideneamino]imidazole-4-carboxamide isomerase [Candidatus Bathyarchaeia archaeon]